MIAVKKAWKRIIIGMLVCVSTLGLAGCGEHITELTEEETQLVAEYAAGLVLKYDTSFENRLLSEYELVEAEAEEAKRLKWEAAKKEAAEKYKEKLAQAEKEKAEAAGNASGRGESSAASAVAVDNLAGFYGLESFNASYLGYELTDTYPESGRDDFFLAMDATKGNQFCIVKLNVTNISGSTADFDMFSKGANIYAVINGNKVHAQYTLLLDDFAAYKGEIEPNASEEMVLVFEISDEITSIDSLSLSVRNGDLKGNMTCF